MLPPAIVLDGVGLELSALLRIPSTHDLHDVFVDFSNHLFSLQRYCSPNLPHLPEMRMKMSSLKHHSVVFACEASRVTVFVMFTKCGCMQDCYSFWNKSKLILMRKKNYKTTHKGMNPSRRSYERIPLILLGVDEAAKFEGFI